MIARRRRTNSGSEDQTKDYSPGVRLGAGYGTGSVRSGTPPRASHHDPNMTCRDRSTEFMAVVKSLQSRQGNGVIARTTNRDLRNRSEFTQIARHIGKDLANTFAKLEKLTILAKRKSLFDDNTVEIQELTYIIKQDIGNLNKQIAQLQQLAKSQKTHSIRQHVQTHSNSVVVGLQSKLATMSNEFKQVLEVRTENLKQQKSRRDHFSQSPVSSSMPPSAFNGHAGSVLLQDEAKSGYSGGDVAINMDGEGHRYQQQVQLIEDQDSYIQDRANTMQNIETTIVELGSIFQQLAHMVKEQEEMVQRIDHNVEDAQLNVEGAHSELLKYFQSVTNNRWLMIKIFAVLIVFFVIFVVFMA
ncbi:syntaxin-5-like [Liolophura sinensis]|uniref:syntaxin-5-like n=1 Tax=Liolophura sinensis TaxID=3198878 RepID=UPI0031595153